MTSKESYTIVTGAGSGIGKEVALHLGKSTKVLCISKSDNCRETAETIGENAKHLICDFSNIENSESRYSDFIKKNNMNINALVHCAGIIGQEGPIETTNLEQWSEVFSINFFSAVMLSKALLPTFKKQNFGKLIFFSGGGSAYGYPVLPQYSASKTSLVRFVENLEMEISEYPNISTFIIAPGAVDTTMFKEVKEKEKAYGKTTEIRSFSMIEDVAKFVELIVNSNLKKLSGRLIHIRDDWKSLAAGDKDIENAYWKLRRVQK